MIEGGRQVRVANLGTITERQDRLAVERRRGARVDRDGGVPVVVDGVTDHVTVRQMPCHMI